MATSEGSKEADAKSGYSVLPQRLSKGPHGLGDPEDRSLRIVEKDVLIPKIMKEIANVKCAAEVKGFSDCGKAAGFMVAFKCRQENKVMTKCLLRWYEDKAFVKYCKEEYLRRRSEYRETGISQKQRKKESATF